MSATTQELQSIMAQSTGTQAYHKMSLTPVKCTDGVRDVVVKAEAFWLVDAIGSYQGEEKVKKEEFQTWKLEVKNETATLSMTDGNTDKKIVEQYIDYTDFPEGEWKFYLTDGVLMVPSEY